MFSLFYKVHWDLKLPVNPPSPPPKKKKKPTNAKKKKKLCVFFLLLSLMGPLHKASSFCNACTWGIVVECTHMTQQVSVV